MLLTKFGHSCVRLEDGDRRLVIDPGVFSDIDAALDGVSDILVTHEHPDHVDVDAIKAALARDSRLRVWAPSSVTALLGISEQVVEPGAEFSAGGFAVRTFGGQHAVIHPTIPVVPNVGYLVDGAVYHPGDALIVPPVDVAVLLAPIQAPWSRTAEVIDFVVSVRAPRAVGIHDAMLTPPGLGIVEGHLARIGGEHGVAYRALKTGESIPA